MTVEPNSRPTPPPQPQMPDPRLREALRRAIEECGGYEVLRRRTTSDEPELA
jgi:hypothetical protein